MEKERYFFEGIDDLKEKLMKLFALEYGDNLSMDELIKFKSIDKLISLTVRKRFTYLKPL